MPALRWNSPRTIAPIRTYRLSVSGLNKAGSPFQVLAGLIICTSWYGKSPKNPPESTPAIVVEIPQYRRSLQKDLVPPRGFIFFIATIAAMIIMIP